MCCFYFNKLRRKSYYLIILGEIAVCKDGANFYGSNVSDWAITILGNIRYCYYF